MLGGEGCAGQFSFRMRPFGSILDYSSVSVFSA
jgi:hypothetical protein